jgi:hypothetical protein
MHYVRQGRKVIANKHRFTQVPISMALCHEKMSYLGDKLSALVESRKITIFGKAHRSTFS